MNPRKLLNEVGSRLFAAVDALAGGSIIDNLREIIECQNAVAGHSNKIIEIQKRLISLKVERTDLLVQQVKLQSQLITALKARLASNLDQTQYQTQQREN